MNIRNPAAAILKYCTPILKINKYKQKHEFNKVDNNE